MELLLHVLGRFVWCGAHRSSRSDEFIVCKFSAAAKVPSMCVSIQNYITHYHLGAFCGKIYVLAVVARIGSGGGDGGAAAASDGSATARQRDGARRYAIHCRLTIGRVKCSLALW